MAADQGGEHRHGHRDGLRGAGRGHRRRRRHPALIPPPLSLAAALAVALAVCLAGALALLGPLWLLWPGEAWAARSAIAARADVRVYAPVGRGFGVRVDHALGRSVATDRAILPRMGKNCFFVNRVIDGDTLRLRNGERVRLIGVDTPETKHPRKPVEPFGPEATAFTRAAIEHRLIGIERNTAARDKYGRLLAYVFRKPDRLFLNAELVRQGFGRAYTRFPFRRKAQFVALEREARRSRRGLWAAETAAIREPPAPRRQGGPPGGEITADQPPAGRADCAIKGNIGKGGQRIYHVPGSAWYARTRIDEARGERWFCTESEARRAGWRPPLE